MKNLKQKVEEELSHITHKGKPDIYTFNEYELEIAIKLILKEMVEENIEWWKKQGIVTIDGNFEILTEEMITMLNYAMNEVVNTFDVRDLKEITNEQENTN